MQSDKAKASKECANWDRGKCLGAMFTRKKDKLYVGISSKHYNKECFADRGCGYFNHVVTPIRSY